MVRGLCIGRRRPIQRHVIEAAGPRRRRRTMRASFYAILIITVSVCLLVGCGEPNARARTTPTPRPRGKIAGAIEPAVADEAAGSSWGKERSTTGATSRTAASRATAPRWTGTTSLSCSSRSPVATRRRPIPGPRCSRSRQRRTWCAWTSTARATSRPRARASTRRSTLRKRTTPTCGRPWPTAAATCGSTTSGAIPTSRSPLSTGVARPSGPAPTTTSAATSTRCRSTA
jgi:hypothetical protein